jgi:hypothetical protein
LTRTKGDFFDYQINNSIVEPMQGVFMKSISILILMCFGLCACGGGGGGGGASGGSTIKAADYTLPTAVPSVPDQAAKQ